MNIFVVDRDASVSAQQLCDKHVVKMVLESAQMLCIPFRLSGQEAPYALAHRNHPCSVWARTSRQNYEWLLQHAFALSNEYTARYKKSHKSLEAIRWCANNYSPSKVVPDGGLTEHAICMPDFCKISSDPVECYRYYYVKVKKKFAKWKYGNTPAWYTELSEKLYGKET